jgi:serine phosphatase RsbU (regulator of sigma subunit)
MLVPVLALTVALVVLGAVSARSAAERTGAAALRVQAVRAQSELRSFLAQAERLSKLVVTEILPPASSPAEGSQESTAPHGAASSGSSGAEEGPAALRQQALRLSALTQAFPAATVAVVAWPDGRAAGAIRDPDGPVLFEVERGVMTEWRIAEDGTVAAQPHRSYAFEPRERPWYRSALDLREPHWTAPYAFVRRDVPGFDLGISFVRSAPLPPEDQPTATPEGSSPPIVIAVDVTFHALSRFLAEAPAASRGEVLIVDDQYAVLATSSGDPATVDGSMQTLPVPFGERLSALARERGNDLASSNGGPEDPAGDRVFTTRRGRQELLAAGESLTIAPGRDWFVVATVPTQALLGEVRQVQLSLLLLSAVALASAIGGLLWLVARVSRPVEKLQAHVQRLGAGEQPGPLDLRASRELESLSSDLNAMATALRERTSLQRSLALAREIQQALLPAPALERHGVTLLGHIDYCDAAGGDYFDFIEISGRDGVLVAVGDVMGHGVASTILMATARAALRTEARRTESLGAMLLRVSSVLLQGRRHGRFMTMFLLHVDPRTRRIRWANAGHDPGLLVLPGATDATVLGGGDLPLGIDEGVVYFEQSMELPPGTLLYVGTDGIREAQGVAGDQFGEARLHAALVALAGRPLPEVRDGLLDTVRQFRHGHSSSDDVTVVLGSV